MSPAPTPRRSASSSPAPRRPRGDRERWTLEDRLPQLLRELETQAAEAEERRLAKEREEAKREREWAAAMERTKYRLVEDHRNQVLRQRVRAWEEADAIRAYCDAVETGTARTPSPEIRKRLPGWRWLASTPSARRNYPGDEFVRLAEECEADILVVGTTGM